MNSEEKREVWIDWMRVIACFMVMIVIIVGIVAVIIQRIPKVGKYIMG